MARAIVVALVFALVGITTAGQVSADCPDSDIDITVIRALIDAKEVATLDAVFANSSDSDPALAAVYHNRRLALLSTADEERRFLQSLPTTGPELWRIYELTNTRGICDDPVVIDVVYGMFRSAAKLIKSQGNGHREFIALCKLTDGELAEAAWGWYDWLLKRDTTRTVEAIRSIPKSSDRLRLCEGVDPIGLSLPQAVSQCLSGISPVMPSILASLPEVEGCPLDSLEAADDAVRWGPLEKGQPLTKTRKALRQRFAIIKKSDAPGHFAQVQVRGHAVTLMFLDSAEGPWLSGLVLSKLRSEPQECWSRESLRSSVMRRVPNARYRPSRHDPGTAEAANPFLMYTLGKNGHIVVMLKPEQNSIYLGRLDGLD